MDRANLTAEASIVVFAPIDRVWSAMATTKGIKKYFWNVDVETDWNVGSPILFKGVWEGKTFEDRGTIRKFEPNAVFEYTYWTSFSGTEYSEERTQLVTNEFRPQNGAVLVTIRQTGIATEEARVHSQSNWEALLTSIKDSLESESA